MLSALKVANSIIIEQTPGIFRFIIGLTKLGALKEAGKHIANIEIVHLYREENRHTDALVDIVATMGDVDTKTIEVSIYDHQIIARKKLIMQILGYPGVSWMDPIIAYLRDDSLQQDKIRKRSIKNSLNALLLFKMNCIEDHWEDLY
ncbi:hypothetical protein FRX31_017372 [Thalictrum thalictroides]|uniref:Uncharacterized protein n=1 Tax=Thalictrum thalictroides TaxID=46969 RepID=A0A7J6W7Q5_THATH|nr:hypothetical protein FRX31_017372 [Thalictrum thalictroides]